MNSREVFNDNEIIEYRGFSNLFACLLKRKGKYYLIYANTKNATIELKSEEMDIIFHDGNFIFPLLEKSGTFKIDFAPKNDVLVHFVELQTKEQFYTIVNVVKDIIGD